MFQLSGATSVTIIATLWFCGLVTFAVGAIHERVRRSRIAKQGRDASDHQRGIEKPSAAEVRAAEAVILRRQVPYMEVASK